MKRLITLSLMILMAAGHAGPARAADTEPRFPDAVEFTHGGESFELGATGVGVRRKLMVRVYTVSHYLENGPVSALKRTAGGRDSALLEDILSDRYAKQLIIEADRDIPHAAISRNLRNGFWRGSGGETTAELEALLEQFLQEIRRDVAEGERLVVRWLPGGRMVSLHDGKVVSEIENEAFVRRFWSIWFGEGTSFDTAALLARAEDDGEGADTAAPAYLGAGIAQYGALPAVGH